MNWAQLLSELLVKVAVFFLAGEVCAHHVRARLSVLALLDQIGQRLIDQRLDLPPLVLRDGADGGQDFRVDLVANFSSGWRMANLA